MLQTTEAGSIKLTNIIDDQRMSSLYEHFALEYYRRHFPELNATPSSVPWDIDDGFTEFLPAMKTDITLCLGERVLIMRKRSQKLSGVWSVSSSCSLITPPT